MSKAISKGVHGWETSVRVAGPNKEVSEGKITVRWDLHPEEAPIVREMFRLASRENHGFKLLLTQLTAKG